MIQAIILAGGLGTRLRPLTDSTPKPLLKIKGKPIIECAIDNFKKHNITNIILSVGYKADLIKDYFGDGKKFGVNITYSVETEPLGTGGAIKKAAKSIQDKFIAINGDNLADFDWTSMLNDHKNADAKITMALYPVEDVTQYGIAQLEKNKIINFIEKPSVEEAPSNLNNAGAYIIEPEVLNNLPNGKCSIEKDCFEKISKNGLLAAFIHKGQWFPTDTLEKYTTANKLFTHTTSLNSK